MTVVVSVVVLKKPLTGSGTALSNPTSMYNYAIRRLMERISWFVDDAGGEASVTFAHVRRRSRHMASTRSAYQTT